MRDADATAGDLVALLVCDIGAIMRGRWMRASDFRQQPHPSVGWVPAGHLRAPFGEEVEPNPFGPLGDLRLLADVSTHVTLPGEGSTTALEFVVCDMVEPDGRAWDCCPRTFLRDALDDLQEELGARCLAAFEHEFQLLLDRPPPPAMSLDAHRRLEPFPTRVMKALSDVGAAPQRFVPEPSTHQFEIPVAAAEGLASADRSVILREVVREVARRSDVGVTFTPLLDPAEQGNGVHVHLRLVENGGRNLFYDSARPGGLSELGGRFAAGILRHAHAITAVTAPSPISYERLKPGKRSAGGVCVGYRNREALLRLPPLITIAQADPAQQMRFEYRAADATANPYLALGMLIKAGIHGVRNRYPPPALLHQDPADLQPDQARAHGVAPLPVSLGEALAALAGDETARGWMPPRLYDVYTRVKQAELEAADGSDLGELCRRYGAVY